MVGVPAILASAALVAQGAVTTGIGVALAVQGYGNFGKNFDKAAQAYRSGANRSAEDVQVKDLKRFPDNRLDELGGEAYTQPIKDKTGKSKSDLYWNPQTGDVYTMPKNGGPPQHVDTVTPRR